MKFADRNLCLYINQINGEYILDKKEYQNYGKKSRNSDIKGYSLRLLLWLLLSGGLIVFNVDSIDIDVNFNFKKSEVSEVKTNESIS